MIFVAHIDEWCCVDDDGIIVVTSLMLMVLICIVEFAGFPTPYMVWRGDVDDYVFAWSKAIFECKSTQ